MYLPPGQVKERGPYIYREQETKMYVEFPGTSVRFRDWRHQVFDAAKTAEECGTSCTEHDMVRFILITGPVSVSTTIRKAGY